MRILLNYNLEDKAYLQIVANMCKDYGVTNVAATSKEMQIGSLIDTAKQTNSDAIILANINTLEHCVQGSKISLDSYRGSRLNFSIPAIVVNRLEHIHTVPHGKWLLEKDLAKLSRIKEPIEQFKYQTLERIEQFTEAFNEISKAIFIVFDVETTPKGGGLITSYAYSALMPDLTWRNYAVPLLDFGTLHHANDKDFADALEFMRNVNALEIIKVCHNGNYDAGYAFKYRAPLNCWTLDTMILWYCWYCELPKDLAFIASVLLYDYYQWKYELEQARRNKDLHTHLAYNAKDTWNTGRILLELLKQIPPYTITNYRKVFPKVFPALYCAFEGFKVDREKHDSIRKESEIRMERSLKNLRTMTADPMFNPGSPKQISEFLFDIIGARKTTKFVKGKGKIESESTDEKALAKISQQHPLLARICDDILDYRKGQKAFGTYFEKPMDHKDFQVKWLKTENMERLLYTILVAGTESMRFSSQMSIFYIGAQVQNIPGKDSKAKINARGFCCADEGFELIEADKNKAEARCVAYFAKCEELIKALETPDKDFYKILATIFFAMTYEEVSKDLRNNVVKRIIHGTNYMMQEDTFIETATSTRLYEAAGLLLARGILTSPVTNLKDFAKYLLNLYHEKFPEVKDWYEEIKEEVRETHKLTSPFGYVRYVFGNIDKSGTILRSCVAHLPQNLSVDVVNEGFEGIYKELVLKYPKDIRLKYQNHDSVMSQVRITSNNELRMFYVDSVNKLMDIPVMVKGRELRIPVDFKIGSHWDEMQEYHYDPLTKELKAA